MDEECRNWILIVILYRMKGMLSGYFKNRLWPVFYKLRQMVMFQLDTYPGRSLLRNTNYLVQFFLTSLFAYLWLEYTRMGGMFRSVYPLIVAGIVVGTQYLMLETGGRYFFRKWGPFRISMASFWVLSFAAVFSGFVMVYFNAQCPGVEKVFPDIFYFYTEHPDPLPSRFAVFYKIILVPWILSNLIVTMGELKSRLDRELITIRRINGELEKKRSSSGLKEAPPPDTLPGYFTIVSGNINKKIAFRNICYISAADHYCELGIKSDDGFCQKLIRLSLKEAKKKLPQVEFEQVHRSHIVNLNYVKKIVSKGQSYQLMMTGMDVLIPASRHRAQDFLPKLSNINQS